MTTQRRPLEDLITELASGLADVALVGDAAQRTTIRPVGAVFDLPMEASVGRESGKPVVLTDFPPCRMRTRFDRPIGRLTLTLSTEGPP